MIGELSIRLLFQRAVSPREFWYDLVSAETINGSDGFSCWLGCYSRRQCSRWGAQVQAGASHAEKGGATAAEVNFVPSAHQVRARATHTQTLARTPLARGPEFAESFSDKA